MALDQSSYIIGSEIKELEDKLSNFVVNKRCIRVTSRNDVVLIAMIAFSIGIDNEVITTSFKFIATAKEITILG
jgi:UDP-2-acetamido-2-deoxy-ribo-hexuluronate aminotransferase